jgi:hypothetical protein
LIVPSHTAPLASPGALGDGLTKDILADEQFLNAHGLEKP